MAWIELHQSVWTHRKTLLMAACLDVPPLVAAAHMIHLWTWALDNAQDGDLSGLPDMVIAAGAGWTGDAEPFVVAAVQAGYLDREEDSLILHDWQDYAGRLIERREQQRERMRQTRSKRASRAHNVRSTDTSREQLPNHTEPNLADEDDDGTLNEAEPAAPPERRPDPDKTECLELIARSRPDWTLSGERFRDLLEYEDRLPWAVIRLAVDRTLSAGAKDLKYCLRILGGYVERGVRTVADVAALDAEFEATKQRRSRATSNRGGKGQSPPSSNVILRREQQPGKWDGVFKTYDTG